MAGEHIDPSIKDINALAIVMAGAEVLTSGLEEGDPDRTALINAKDRILAILLAGEAASHQPKHATEEERPALDNSTTQN